MRAFHMAWLAFFFCFFGWFGIAPLTAVIRDELGLTKAQVGNTIIASVAVTILARLMIGWLCDRLGPRLCYSGLLLLGAIPVMGIGFAHDYLTFLWFRLAIGAIGASFVITQYHTSLMFASNCVGTANATTAGWGNMGGGAAQLLMPLLFSGFIALGLASSTSWRLAMLVPGVAMIVTGVLYYLLTQDTPAGSIREWKRTALKSAGKGSGTTGSFLAACQDRRVWALASIYGACFGIEITIHNTAALYFTDRFGAGLRTAGVIVGIFGMLAIFARTLGGLVSDRVNRRLGLRGRAAVLTAVLLAEGLFLVAFSRAASLPAAVVLLTLFGLFVHMSCGATYALIPFVNRKAVGSVAGIVGAGGNVGAVASGFLFRMESVSTAGALMFLGIAVTGAAGLGLLVRFSKEDELAANGVSRPVLDGPMMPAAIEAA
jgi:NNP family nitrate/nitrite transporter-like MFS transporter